MTTYIALLRAINVSGKNMIKMADLKRMCEEMGLSQVQTYIQSGNVVFQSPEEPEPLRARIEEEITRVFGLSVTVILRSAADLEQIISESPFSPDALKEGESLYVYFYTEALPPEDLDRLPSQEGEIDEYRVQGREIYILFRQRLSDSKLPIKLQKLRTPATGRNWNTTTKLSEMAKNLKP